MYRTSIWYTVLGDLIMDINIYEAPLSEERNTEYKAFLVSAGLRDEEDADFIAWMKDDSGRLVACGALAGHTIKQLAVDPSIEGTGAMAQIMTAIIREAYDRGNTRLFLCTKPKNYNMMASLGFNKLIAIDDAVLLENRRNGLEKFLAKTRQDAEEHRADIADITCGAVVCNCDPFTLGHRNLIEYASRHCDFLYVFAVAEAGSRFTPEDRLEMIKQGTADLENCHVYSSELYLVSRATFPAYFIRDEEHADEVRSDLDITLFAERIAPALNITKRFVGQEPFSPVTNARMKKLLPEYGIELVEIPRFAVEGDELAVSASRVRKLFEEGDMEAVKALVPETTYKIIEKYK